MATATVTAPDVDGNVKVFDYLLRLYGLTITDASELTGISKATMHNWLAGNSKMSRLSIGALERAFDLPASVRFFDMEHRDALQWLLDNKSAQFECFV